MKTVLERPKSQLVTVMMLSFVMICWFRTRSPKRHIDLFGDLGNLIQTLPELPCKIVSTLTTFPERMDPTSSECR